MATNSTTRGTIDLSTINGDIPLMMTFDEWKKTNQRGTKEGYEAYKSNYISDYLVKEGGSLGLGDISDEGSLNVKLPGGESLDISEEDVKKLLEAAEVNAQTSSKSDSTTSSTTVTNTSTSSSDDGESSKKAKTISDYYENLIKAKFNGNASNSDKEVIDIVTQYRWNVNKINGGISSSGDTLMVQNNIPYCFVTEYKQLYNASISNIVNNIYGIGNLDSSFSDGNMAKDATSLLNTLTDWLDINSSSSSSKNAGSAIVKAEGENTIFVDTSGKSSDSNNDTSWLSQATSKVKNSISSFTSKYAKQYNQGPCNTLLLSPYTYMYALSPTNKMYSFPLFEKSSSFFNVGNKFSDSGHAPSHLLGNTMIDRIHNTVSTGMGFIQDLNMLYDAATNQANGYKQYQIERAKYFKFPDDGEKFTINFVFYNTVEKDMWKNHYKFIVMFLLRNLPFKIDNISFFPPLFYDVIIPGVKRYPISYVSNFTATPLGLSRVLAFEGSSLNNMLGTTGGNSYYSVNVPEAWQIQIEFTCLIAPTANLILSSLIDMPITAKIKS